MIKYIGSKRKLLTHIENAIYAKKCSRSFLDVFAGTSRVGYHFKKLGFTVHSNDHNEYAATIARGIIEAEKIECANTCKDLLTFVNNAKPIDGWFTQTYARNSRFFSIENAMHIEGAREYIENHNSLNLPENQVIKSVLLTSLMLGADKVDSTVGIQMAYLKTPSHRSQNKVNFKLPPLLDRKHARCSASCMDAVDFLKGRTADVIYLDPPYNQHSYRSNYHIWETLVKWDKPEVYGVAQKRVDCHTLKSPFNYKKTALNAMKDVIDACDCNVLVISFSNEGHIARKEFEEMLNTRGTVETKEISHKRYIGSRLGKYTSAGIKTGEETHNKCIEYLFTVTCK